MYRFARPDKRRPVLLLTRDASLAHLNAIIVAPITRTRRGVPSELLLGIEQGLKEPCAANFFNIAAVPTAELGPVVGTLSEALMEQACRALSFALGCDEALLH